MRLGRYSFFAGGSFPYAWGSSAPLHSAQNDTGFGRSMEQGAQLFADVGKRVTLPH